MWLPKAVPQANQTECQETAAAGVEEVVHADTLSAQVNNDYL